NGIKNIDSWTYDEKENKMKIINEGEIIEQGQRQCYLLTTMSGHEIECTDNHPFLTQRGWVELKDLDIEKDKVSICKSSPFFGNSDLINEDEAALLGYMTADGNCSQGNTFFTCENEEILKDFKQRINNISDNLKVFNDPWTKAKSKRFQYKITSNKNVNINNYCEERQRTISRHKLNDLMLLMEKWQLKGKTCHKKTVPLELFKCPKNVISSYLKALFSCDGNISSRKRNNSKIIIFEFTSVNKEQIFLIQQLLSKFGILANVRKKRTKSKIIGENGKVYNYDMFSYVLFFNRKKYINILLEEIGIIGKDVFVKNAAKMLSGINENIKTTHKDNTPHSFIKIRSIEKTELKRTFDISVSSIKTLQNFTAQSFLVHNSGKDFISSIIALYEAMKLLECEGGDPYSIYELSSANTINILTIANSKEQAKLAFEEIKSKLLYSKYFEDKYSKDGFTSESIYLLTPKDRNDNKILKEKGLPLKKGSVGIIVGHSNSDSLLGMGCIVLILDEVASYKMTGGSSSGDRIYTALLPTVSTYCRKIYKKDEKGNFILNEFNQKIVDQRIYDGKVVSISSPRGREGKFYELYENAGRFPQRLVLRLPTWDVNPTHTRQSLRDANMMMNEMEFNMEFGAEFSGLVAENFFTESQIDSCFNGHNFKHRDYGEPGKIYFIHLDPATSSHNYALVIAHKEYFINSLTNKMDYMIVVDHIKYWYPVNNGVINVIEVSDYVVALKRKFNIGLLTSDQWASQESLIKIRKAGIPTKVTRFNHSYKNIIYGELENLVNSSRIKIPFNFLLRNEMLELRRKYTPTGFRVLPKTDGEGAKSDDIIDCVAGCSYSALQGSLKKLPHGKLIDMP
ncbi:MAG: LAGLIDADG family homing endonuclease, partial [Clostridia bacterium]